MDSKSGAEAADEGVVGHHGGIDAVVGDEAAIESKVGYDALIVHDSPRDARFPDAAWADERNVLVLKNLRDGLLYDRISSEEDGRLGWDVISRIERGLCGRSIVQE